MVIYCFNLNRFKSFFIIFVLIYLFDSTICEYYGQERLRSHFLHDDEISHTDYLITIYSSSNRKPCSYFSESRFSQPESSLINCTWYKTNACCKRTEVASVFLSMYTLNQASQSCMNMMNYMMCYFCSPDQYVWYRGSQVAVCLKFCNEIYEKCKEAEYGGFYIGDFYKDGKAFCEAQDFKVISSNQQCFDFDPTPFSKSTRLKLNSISLSVMVCFLNLILTVNI